ncbi:YitT family protein [Bacillus songklensis]|uniref:YitT family protein n=1 Tax=Bacillus songklensis TaxID=1069116 RepID=A0ABV8B103_9BACI
MLQKTLAAFLGSFLLGIGISGFLAPYHLLDGGVIGIAPILHYYFSFPTGLCMIVLSTPLYLYAWKYERNYFYNSLNGLLLSSLLIDWLSPLRHHFDLPIFLSAILGGTLVGIGIGLMLRYETSTGGTDLVAQILAKWTSWNVGILIFVIDSIVVLSGIGTIGLTSFMFSLVVISVVGVTTSLMVIVPSVR